VLALIVLFAAGILTSSTSIRCAPSTQRMAAGHAPAPRPKLAARHVAHTGIATVALGAVMLAIHVQLGQLQ
jgi:hypothetical protein